MANACPRSRRCRSSSRSDDDDHYGDVVKLAIVHRTGRVKLAEPVRATPAITHDTLYVRSDKFLYAFRK